MILGIGTDIVEIGRIRAIFERHTDRFLKRVFTEEEKKYSLQKKDPSVHFAGRFAAKEAIVKALGTGFSDGLTWLDIEIQNDAKGKPIVAFSSFAKEQFGDLTMHLSISHCREYATAFAIWTRNPLTNTPPFFTFS